jgi:L-ascorbate metabolism protein UlaG (beta-lactamase superfamily)
MKKIIIVVLLNAMCCAWAQRVQSDKIPTDKGEIEIQPLLHAAMMIKWDNKVIYVDPYGGKKVFEGLPKPDIILITDIHQDHMNMSTLDSIETSNAMFVVPHAVEKQLPDKFKKNIIAIKNGMKTEVKGIPIETIPMYNLPESADAMHTKGRGNGYVLNLGGKKIYISGDTEDIKEMRELKNIDIAFVCMNLPYTMDIDQAASAVLEFQPKIVYPYHYRGKEGMSDTVAFKKLVNKSNGAIDVRLRNWYATF